MSFNREDAIIRLTGIYNRHIMTDISGDVLLYMFLRDGFKGFANMSDDELAFELAKEGIKYE